MEDQAAVIEKLKMPLLDMTAALQELQVEDELFPHRSFASALSLLAFFWAPHHSAFSPSRGAILR